MRAVALLVTLSVASSACFPNNARHRTYAKITEGVSLATGVGMMLFADTGADCMPVAGRPQVECTDRASLVSSIGLGLILAGLLGFVVTVSTTPDDKKPAPPLAPLPVAPAPAPPPAAPAPAPPVAPAPAAPAAGP